MGSAISRVRTKVSEEYCWYFLLAVFFIPALIDNWKLVTNLYRVWICIPILLCIRWCDFRLFIRNQFVQLFFIMTGWFSLSLAWSPEDSKVINMATRILTTLILLYLIWLVCHYHGDKQEKLKKYYVYSALCLSIMTILSWEGLTEFNRNGSAFGAFYKPGPLSWFLCSAALMSFFIACEQDKVKLQYFFLTVFFITVMLLTESRSSIVMFFAGIIAFILLGKNIKNISFFLLACFFITLPALGFEYLNPGKLTEFLERADSYRFLIYKNGLLAITETPQSLLFGNGLAAEYIATFEPFKDNNLHFHMLYMNIAYQTGIVGVILFFIPVLFRLHLILTKKNTHNSWDLILIAMLFAMIFDGSKFYNYPGGIMFALVIPLFMANLASKRQPH